MGKVYAASVGAGERGAHFEQQMEPSSPLWCCSLVPSCLYAASRWAFLKPLLLSFHASQKGAMYQVQTPATSFQSPIYFYFVYSLISFLIFPQ